MRNLSTSPMYVTYPKTENMNSLVMGRFMWFCVTVGWKVGEDSFRSLQQGREHSIKAGDCIADSAPSYAPMLIHDTYTADTIYLTNRRSNVGFLSPVLQPACTCAVCFGLAMMVPGTSWGETHSLLTKAAINRGREREG